ncbi:MAG: UDP-3-O-3-hydroxymyristoyl N-acetylglucosamine deacetylase [Candidatus Saganbacteria bacterium]|uniref:UDP-3-O-acyl-N-acetylglucosamine deacetylase n=1 Tax=Candidatus Saganbacteria bacterium TaxID=2575572 RepID=A0A833NRW3_UNCSA|nr:MAG: UDP-3-O-3-hydroxymyristoyl N-acetylglucosamine deacetylase [Candidatus Saganbacteria bacterium]
MSLSGDANQGSQKTIKNPFQLSGIGIHSGENCTIIFNPAGLDCGIYFIYKNEKIPALASLVADTSRGTSLKNIHVVEHVLAAAAGLGISNLEIVLSHPEPPVLDGSALPYFIKLKEAVILAQDKEIKTITISSAIKLNDGEASLEIRPYNSFKINFMIYFPYIGEQNFVYDGNFESAIAPARTFGLLEELEMLKKRGLAKGASFDNSLAIGPSGYLNAPRFSNEPVRHKILDLIGDLSLTGAQIRGEVFAVKSGHKLNVELARRLIELC